MLSSLEIPLIVGAFLFLWWRATRLLRNGLEQPAVRGPRTCANGNGGSPGTWEILSSPWKLSRRGIPGDQPQARWPSHAVATGAKRRVFPWYRPCEGNEARREGRQEVAVP
jgi:hypothetical protein